MKNFFSNIEGKIKIEKKIKKDKTKYKKNVKKWVVAAVKVKENAPNLI